jgi:aspartate 1-decarboxylase
MKDLAADQLRKARTDVVTLTGAMGVGGTVTGSGAFPEQRAGLTSPGQTVTVTNTGTKPLPIAEVSVTDRDGTSAQTFTADGAACVGKTLALGATCEVQVRFTPTKAGAVSAATVMIGGPEELIIGSLPLTGTATAVFSFASDPTISNLSPTVGDTLTASTQAWAPVAEFSYQWLRDGQPIGGASSTSYAVTDADTGHRISVAVTGTATGHVPESRTSAPTHAVAARALPTPPTQHVTKRVKPAVSVKALSKRRIQVTVSAEGVPAAQLKQKVTVRIAGVKKTYRVRLIRGRATIRLAGAAATTVRTGKKVRVTVLVPTLTTTRVTPGVVTTSVVARATKRTTVTVRR